MLLLPTRVFESGLCETLLAFTHATSLPGMVEAINLLSLGACSWDF